jgi:hypothetical protein
VVALDASPSTQFTRFGGAMADLHVEIRWNRIIVTMPGTSFSATYRREVSGMERIGLKGSEFNDPTFFQDFIARADEVANEHARQLGWIV